MVKNTSSSGLSKDDEEYAAKSIKEVHIIIETLRSITKETDTLDEVNIKFAKIKNQFFNPWRNFCHDLQYLEPVLSSKFNDSAF